MPVIGYGLLCALSLAAGGAIAAYRPASDRVRSIFQHAAAGLVFAAAGVEVLPDVMHRHLPIAATLGFGIGVVVLLAIRAGSDKLCAGRGATALIAVVVVDIFIDGLLIGVSAATARSQGQQALLVTIALAVELLTLGLSIAAELTENGTNRRRIVVTTSTIALTPLAGAIAGYFLGGVLSGAWVEGVLAFAVAALLYLAAEELLTEAHETAETAAGTAVLLFAFLAMMIIHMLTAPA
ncbi:MAG TPA: transporter [Telluria sp.]|nr:transporter [Telluria sp.]